MPTYNYLCLDCVSALEKEIGTKGLKSEVLMPIVFETRHAFDPTEDDLLNKTKCPFCESHNTEKTMLGVGPPHYRIRGLGHQTWQEFREKNKSAIGTDMALHQLETADPYANIRPEGDKEDTADRIRSNRKKKSKQKHYIISSKNK